MHSLKRAICICLCVLLTYFVQCSYILNDLLADIHVFQAIISTSNPHTYILRKQVTQKDPNVAQLFGRVWRPQTLRCWRGGHAHFPTKRGPQKSKLELSATKNVSSIGQQMAE